MNFIGGWVELKWLRNWPAKPETPVKIDHYTAQQKVWAVRRSRAGGKVWLLLQVRQEWLLFEGAVAARHLGKVPRDELYPLAHRVWRQGLNDGELLECFLNTSDPKSAC